MNHQITQQNPTAITPATSITLALNSPLAVNADPEALKLVLATATAKAFADTGANINGRMDEVQHIVQNLPAEVTRTLPAIRLSEIPIAINRGIMLQFGDYYGLSVATFMRFLTAHYQSEQRLQAIKSNRAATTASPEAPKPTAQQLQQTRMARVATAFAHYKAQGYYKDHGNLVFDIINTMGKIPFSPQREAAILERARQNMINSHSRMPLYADERAPLRATLNQILAGEAPNLILAEAKRLALFELFDDMIEAGVEVAEFLSVH